MKYTKDYSAPEIDNGDSGNSKVVDWNSGDCQKLKLTASQIIKTWSITSSLNGIKSKLAGCGTTSAALSFGGSSGVSYLDTTEKWSGTAWTTTSALLTRARNGLAGCGTTSAALAFGGGYTVGYSVRTDKWSGTAWATTSETNYLARSEYAACGTTSAALAFGGYSGDWVARTDRWSGTAWSTTSATFNLKQARAGLAGCGTTTDALAFGGRASIYYTNTEKWSGSSWATTGAMNQARYGLAGCGITSDALAFGGNIGGTQVSTTEIWNGSSWSTTISLILEADYLAGCGTTTDALAFGGSSGDVINTTEIWGNQPACTLTFTDPPTPRMLLLKTIQGSSGNETVDWSSNVYLKSGQTTFSVTLGAIDLVQFYFDGTNYLGFINKGYI